MGYPFRRLLALAAGLGRDAVNKPLFYVPALYYNTVRPATHRATTMAELYDRIAVMLGGRAAEKVVFDSISTAARKHWRLPREAAAKDLKLGIFVVQ